MFTVKSVSSDGVYYLYKGWGNIGARVMWSKQIPNDEKYLFKSLRSAKGSVTRLLKIMDDYKEDQLTILEVPVD